MMIANELERVHFILDCNLKVKKLLWDYVVKEFGYESNDYKNFDNIYNNLSFHYFPQIWKNTGCGWAGKGELVGQAFSWSKNFIAISKEYDIAFVFINRYAYTCKVDEKFNQYFLGNEMPGYVDRNQLQIISYANEK